MRLLEAKPSGLKTTSPSQLKTARQCLRKWGWRHIDKIRTPQTDAQRVGTGTHAVAEEWLGDGVVPDENLSISTAKGLRFPGRIVSAGLPLLPPPGVCEVEKKFWLEVEPGVVIYGLIDFLTEIYSPPMVGDHKTTTDFRWMLSEDELGKDEQNTIYAAAGMLMYQSPSVLTRWVYYLNHGTPAARAVDKVRYWDETREALQPLIELARYTLSLHGQVKTALELPPNPNHCGAYGGCEHLHRCQITPGERLRAAMGQFNISDFVAKKKAEEASAAAPTAPPAPAAPPAAPQAAPPAPPAATAAPPITPPAAPPAAPAAPPAAPPTAGAAPPAPAPEGIPPQSVTVPAAPAAPPAEAAPPAAPAPAAPAAPADPPFSQEDLSTWSREQLKAKAIELGLADTSCRWKEKRLRDTLGEWLHNLKNPPTPPPAPVAENGTTFDPTVLQSWTRDQLKEKLVELGVIELGCRWKEERLRETLINVFQNGVPQDPPPPGVPPVPQEPPPPTPPAVVAPPPVTVPVEADKVLEVLYVNCAPVPAGNAVSLSTLLQPIVDSINPAGDYRLHPDLGFGKAGARLSELVVENLYMWQGYEVIASTSYPEHRDVLPALEARAKKVVHRI